MIDGENGIRLVSFGEKNLVTASGNDEYVEAREERENSGNISVFDPVLALATSKFLFPTYSGQSTRDTQ